MPLFAISKTRESLPRDIWYQIQKRNFESGKLLGSLRMAEVQDQLEIKFRLTDGSDIGPRSFPAATSVASLKESILTQWPKG